MITCKFILMFFCVCSVTTLAQPPSEPEKLVDIQSYLKKINKTAVKTINSPDGDFIDCVLFDQQPAFDHPMLRGLNLTTDLPELPMPLLSDNNNTSFEDEEVSQLWKMSGESCPENTIPIRRTTPEDVLRASSVQEFGRKSVIDDSSLHEYGIVSIRRNGDVYGADAYINVWRPRIEKYPEISLSQIWINAGRHNDGSLNTIEAGYIVHSGEQYPRLFIYWTKDAYKNTGCYDLLCHGFVQVSGSHVALGATIHPVSTYDGKQMKMRVTMWKSPRDGNWWLAVNGRLVGYWPSVLFSVLRDRADEVHFGGEIVNLGGPGRHTSTQMGSGHFPNEGLEKAAYMRNLQIVNSKNQLFSTREINTFNNKPECYRSAYGFTRKWGTYMYYGGPGRGAPGCV